jgi:hypothetical protein
LLLVVTPTITLPVGWPFDPPALEVSAWDTQEKALKTQAVPAKPRPPPPPPHPPSLTPPALARRLCAHVHAHHPSCRVHGVTADALYGTATLVEGASALCGGVQVISPGRSPQHMRAHKREQHVAASVATPPGPPPTTRLHGGEAVVAIGASARLARCAHTTKRLLMVLKYAGEARERDRIASDLTWRPLAMVQAHPWRGLVEGFRQAWKAPEGWRQRTKQPGKAGARQGVILSLLVDHGLVLHPDPHAQLQNNRPASTVGSLRDKVQVDCLVPRLDEVVSSEDPQRHLHRFTRAFDEVFPFGRATPPLSPHPRGRLAPTPSLKYRADQVMRNRPLLSP